MVPVYHEEEANFMDLLLYLWDHRMRVAKITGAFLILGVVIILLSRTEYQSTARLVPETESSSDPAANLLQQYSGMLGISAAPMNEGTFTPSLYPDIVNSLPYQVELMNRPIHFSEMDTTMTAHQYFSEFYPYSITDFLYDATLGLPSQIMGLFRDYEERPVLDWVDRDVVINLSGVQKKTLRELRERLVVDQQDGVVILTAELPDPNAAAEIGLEGMKLLKEYVREYRTLKASQELQFVEEQMGEAKERFEEAQRRLADFRDSNVNLGTARALTREQELQSEYDLAYGLYQTLAQNFEQARLRVHEETPVFTTVEPFQLNNNRSQPNIKLILAGSLFLGAVIGVIWLLFRKWWEYFMHYAAAKKRSTALQHAPPPADPDLI